MDYTYDNAGNITGIVTTNGGSSRTDTYGYDGLNRLTSFALGGPTTTYTYDGRGNRTHENGVEKWLYDDANVLTQISGRAVTTDDSGNMTEKPVGTTSAWSMSYDKQNQLLQVEQDEDTQLVNLYDATGKRIRKVEGNRETVYVYMGNNVVYERSADVSTQANLSVTTYIEAAGRTVAKRTDGVTQFMITDHLGSTRVIFGTDGAVLQRFDYKPFGEDLVTTAERGEKYTGKTQDGIGLYYYGARFYDAELGRFVNQDPIKDGLNWYVYTGNNPINRVDPDGKDYILLNQSDGAFFGYGHNACLVGNDEDGWEYYSKDGPFSGNVNLSFDTLALFLEREDMLERYDGGYRIETTREQDAAMKAFGDENYGKAYSLMEKVNYPLWDEYCLSDKYPDYAFESQNCADLAADIAQAGDVNIGKPKKMGITHPNTQYRDTRGCFVGTPIAI